MCCGSYYIKFTMFYKGFSLHIVLAIIMAVTILHADGLQEKKIVSEISKNLKGQLMKSPLEWTKTQVSNEFQSIRLESKAGKHKTQNRLEREKVLSLADEVSENQTSFEMGKVTNILQEIETSFPYPHTPETQVYSEESTSFPSPSSVESPSSSSSTLTLENLSLRPTLKTSGTLTRSSSSTQNESRFEAALIAETTLKGSPSKDIGLGKAGRIPFRSKTVFNEGSRTYPVVRTESGHKPIPSTVKGKSNEVKQGQTEKYPHESSDLEQENVHRNLTSHENFDYVMNETFHEKSAHSLKTEDHKTESYFEETGYVFEDSANTRIKGQEKGLVGDLILSLLLDALKPYYLPTLTENKECRRVVNFGFNKNIKHLDWAMHMFDSWGKISDGFLFGNMHLVGMFEECLAVEGSYKPVLTPAINFTGQYCQIHYRNLKPTNTSTKKSAHSLLVEDLLGRDPLTNWLSRGHRVTGQRRPQGLRSGPALSLLAEPIGFSYATCIPSICSEDDLFTSLNKTLEDHQAIVTKVKCIKVENEEPITYDPPDLAMISFLATVSVWILLSTVYDVTTNCLEMDALRHGWFRVPLCFSLNQSLPALFRQKSGSSPHRITCLPGIR
ncbi:uncharacterized protein LOC143023782 [Oratosquilla oratoria]|uniref:uncharacterized protein LOC143023782 n=1 Tax=Oratosquilla oratoria TaxID=337810 RepID=UPI003F764D1E